MSADNWCPCPKCKKVANDKLEISYGNVPEGEYLRLLENKSKTDENTLREDYEIWTDPEGKFTVSYSCICSVCDFSFEYRYSKQVAV